MKRHYRIVNPLRFFIFILICVILITFAGSTIIGLNKASAASVKTYKQIRIEPNDTLWNIAEEYADYDVDPRDYISDICDINGIDVNNIQAGELIFIPVS